MMNESDEPLAELAVPTTIRVETALSRYPVHRLAKQGGIAIDIREKNSDGEVSVKWEVTHNSKYGQPGPLAYKLDTLLINRRIEEAPRPIPRLIRLGSLKEICRELGMAETGGNTSKIKNSLYQNAFVGITAKIRYRQHSGHEKTLEAGFNRYSVVFTGEDLPDGRKADAVYIILSDVYMQVLSGAMTRPLDYDYLKSLPPAPQRFYELLSFQMYATIKNDRARARLLYSEFCTYAPLTRHLDWESARKQMAKIHRKHRESGYIAKIDYEETTDSDGRRDWIMFYQPGPKARADYRVFTRKGGPVRLEAAPLALPDSTAQARKARRADTQPLQPALPLANPEPPLVTELAGRGVTKAIAAALLREHGEDVIRQQMDIFDAMPAKKREKIDDPAAWLVTAIRNGHAAPKGYIPAAERKRREEERQAKEREDAEKHRQEREEAARQKAEKQAIAAYWDSLTPAQQKAHDADAIAQADAEERKLIEPGPMKRIGMSILRDGYTRKLLQVAGKLPPAKT